MFDRRRLAQASAIEGADFLHRFALDELMARLPLVKRDFPTGLAHGPLSPGLRMAWQGAETTWTFAAPAPVAGAHLVADTQQPFVRAFPLAVSINALHLAADPVSALGELRGVLRADGLMLGAVLASGSYAELADALLTAEAELTGNAAMRVAPFGDVRRWGDALARAGFALPVADEVRIAVTYDSLRPLFADLRAMGARGILETRTPAPRRLFDRADAIFRERYGVDGRLPVTIAFAFLSGWAPDPSQQRPAKRGSATVRLADVLKAADDPDS